MKRYNSLYRHTAESGRSMVEMLGVLAIIGVLSVGGIAGYSQAMSKFKLTQARDQMQQLLSTVRQVYSSQPSYEGLDSQTLINGELLPDTMISDGGGNIVNPWQGEIDVEVASGTISDRNVPGNRVFRITLEELPVDACMELAMADWGSAESTGLLLMDIGGSGGTNEIDFTDGGNTVDISTASSGCASEIITWWYL